MEITKILKLESETVFSIIIKLSIIIKRTEWSKNKKFP